ncbi:hypothetical protein Syun_008526 [Stephania yunnanensis]|uniref:Uncharacterized protein n=1 Tax=Stephania yunnanensis TaxID=152371 RepID=A0AAP0PN91_9MAGN
MGIQRCADVNLDDSNYSSPMPIIGLYVAGASSKPVHGSSVSSPMTQPGEAITIMKSVKKRLHRGNNVIAQEVGVISSFIQRRAYTSIEELHRDLEQLFVDVLSEGLVRLPSIILKEINESSPEDLEKRLKEALKVVSKIRQLEGLVQWSFPLGTTITSLATVASTIGDEGETQETSNSNAITIDADIGGDQNSIAETQVSDSNSIPIDADTADQNPIAEGNSYTRSYYSSLVPIIIRSQTMGIPSCVDSNSSDNSNYSSPVPIIGLYVAGASSVCLLFIALDMYAGFRNRKRWLPCRFFPLNSVTLTLLGIATKLPVDLTTSMPSLQDQLSKLTGTIFICTCMGFFMPSLGICTKSESASNLISLTIFVITVLVNICIQMHTGLINSFGKEHIIILCCMVLMLTMLWNDHFFVHGEKRHSTDYIKDYFSNGGGSLLQRLKVCFLYCYESNPQLRRSRKDVCPVTCALCVACIVVLLKVILQSLISKDLNFSKDLSDYGWSMRAILFSQIVAILVGGHSTIGH